MHRVDADGYITVGGERRWVDRNLPTYTGTLDAAYWNNAVQEEICNVIEYAGLTLATSGATDESAGWEQLKDAIFESGAISNNALATDLSLAKFSQGTLSWTVGGINGSLSTSAFVTDTGGTLSASYDRRGVYYYGSTSPGSVTPYMRQAVYNITSFISGASVDDAISETASGHYHTIGKEYDNVFNTNIIETTKIFDSTITLVQAGGNCTTVSCECEYGQGGGSGDKWELLRVIQFTATSSDDMSAATAVYLTVSFDGSYL